jgi:cytochrome c-type biogenesis protein CcmH/NrfG
VDAGAPEGESLDLPVPPTFSNDWFLGEPDLVVAMEEAFEIPAEGPDVYKNFVIPIPTDRVRHVRAMEFRPGNSRVVHHAFLAIDETGESRRVDDMEEGPGFSGMHLPTSARVPDGQFFSWQPGKVPIGGADQRAWRLGTNSWLVIQLHVQTTGKKETVQSEVGFYFSDQPGTDITFKLGLSSYDLNIAPGVTNHVAEDAFVLPVDVELLAILPHAHYVAREMQGIATRPDGSSVWLINIPQWDFNWQGEYWYEDPIQLPAGSRVGMRFFYDNSTNNLANPSSPPQPVTYGLQSTDEMAELWMMFRVKSAEDRLAMNRAALPKTAREVIAYSQIMLNKDPGSALTWVRKGTAHFSLGQRQQAAEDLQRALQYDPKLDEAHYYLGLIAFQQGDVDAAFSEFNTTIQLNPDNYKAHGYLGLIYMRKDDLPSAEASLLQALEVNPLDDVARANLGRLRAIQENRVKSPSVQ